VPPAPAAVATPDLSPPEPIPLDWATRPRTSLCMIVRNEEKNLPACLHSVEGLFDEVVIADTGSTDATPDIIRNFGARLVEFPWVDSFGAARNASLGQARGKWVMWLDADDRLDAENRQRLQEVLAALGDDLDAYSMKVRSALDPGRTAFRVLDQVRLLRNLPQVRWDYRIHEQILPAVNRAGGGVRWVEVVIDHVGYQDPSLRQTKLNRNLRLLEMDEVDRPTDSFALFNLGWTLMDLGRPAEAHTAERKPSTGESKTQILGLQQVFHSPELRGLQAIVGLRRAGEYGQQLGASEVEDQARNILGA
jgi:hypothetical protein